MEIIGHRGAKGLAEENSVRGVREALKHKVSMVEVDVRLHAGELVLSHDPTLKSENYTKLQAVLDAVDGKTPLNIEIKDVKAIQPILDMLKKYQGEILFSSFEFSILQKLMKLHPQADIAILEKWSGIRAVAEASLLNTNRIHINQTWLWGSFIKSLKHRGYVVYAYTVNTVQRADELASWGVDGIFTDYPNRFV